MKITDEMIEAAKEAYRKPRLMIPNTSEGSLTTRINSALEAALAVAPEPVDHSELIEEVREARDSRDGTTISKLAEVEAERDALQAKLDDVNGLARALANGHAISFQDAQVFVEGALKIQGVPGLQARLDRVRKLHRKWTYYDHEDMCPDTTEEHCEQRHHESDDIGEFYCEDMPTGDVVCEGCRDEFGERVDWPCPTVQALGDGAK